jgi:hypothetical protein
MAMVMVIDMNLKEKIKIYKQELLRVLAKLNNHIATKPIHQETNLNNF